MESAITVDVQPSRGGGSGAVYFLDGVWASADTNSFTRNVKATEIFADSNFMKVYPVGGRASFYTDWIRPARSKNGAQVYRWETFLVEELPEFLNQKFGVERTNYGLVGASMGGTAALMLSHRFPERFHRVTALSPFTHLSAPFISLFGPSLLQLVDGYDTKDMWGGFRLSLQRNTILF